MNEHVERLLALPDPPSEKAQGHIIEAIVDGRLDRVRYWVEKEQRRCRRLNSYEQSRIGSQAPGSGGGSSSTMGQESETPDTQTSTGSPSGSLSSWRSRLREALDLQRSSCENSSDGPKQEPSLDASDPWLEQFVCSMRHVRGSAYRLPTGDVVASFDRISGGWYRKTVRVIPQEATICPRFSPAMIASEIVRGCLPAPSIADKF